MRRIYGAKKGADGQLLTGRKGQALRAVEHCSGEVSRLEAMRMLQIKADQMGADLEYKRGISYLYQRRVGSVYPTREEYFVAGPAGVDSKVRYGMEWFEAMGGPTDCSLFVEGRSSRELLFREI